MKLEQTFIKLRYYSILNNIIVNTDYMVELIFNINSK